MKRISNLKRIYSVQGEFNAELIKARLEAEGIPTVLRYETYFNLYLGTFCPIEVFVQEEYEIIAKKIVGLNEKPMIASVPLKNRLAFIVVRLLAIVLLGK